VVLNVSEQANQDTGLIVRENRGRNNNSTRERKIEELFGTVTTVTLINGIPVSLLHLLLPVGVWI